jgi:hypothetical protein
MPFWQQVYSHRSLKSCGALCVETKSTEPSKHSITYKLAVWSETSEISVLLTFIGGFLSAISILYLADFLLQVKL